MKMVYLSLLVLSPIACLVAHPLPAEQGTANKANSTLPRGVGVPRPALSSAGAGRVRGLSAKPYREFNRSTQSSNTHPRPTSGNAVNVHTPGTNKATGAAKTVNQAAGPKISDVRHHNPNPAIIGGPEKVQSKMTGSLSGTGVSKRR